MDVNVFAVKLSTVFFRWTSITKQQVYFQACWLPEHCKCNSVLFIVTCSWTWSSCLWLVFSWFPSSFLPLASAPRRLSGNLMNNASTIQLNVNTWSLKHKNSQKSNDHIEPIENLHLIHIFPRKTYRYNSPKYCKHSQISHIMNLATEIFGKRFFSV